MQQLSIRVAFGNLKMGTASLPCVGLFVVLGGSLKRGSEQKHAA